jgi:D-glycero-D-manno-heptose 1,7-bisphosphate phosphatase
MSDLQGPSRSIPAVFLDRDGVINFARKDYVKSTEEFVFIPGALEGLRNLATLNFPIIVVTNQSVVGRGIITGEKLDRINEHMIETVKRNGGRIDRVFSCPHKPEEDCDCRKPATGLFTKATKVFPISLSDSWLIGDAETDRVAGESVGCKTLMIQSNTENALRMAVQRILREHSPMGQDRRKIKAC